MPAVRDAGAPLCGETRCQSWRAPSSKRQSAQRYSSRRNSPWARVLLRGRNASSPVARKSLYDVCTPTTPCQPYSGRCVSSRRAS
ncbi:Uncharacterised protein [Bordetella pertussis]|nr:Uncharacterised protein [Bordetella pertussis]